MVVAICCGLIAVAAAEPEVPLQRPSTMRKAPEATAQAPPLEEPPEPEVAPEGTEEQAASQCPCDAIDWRCWQEHVDVCKWEPPPQEPEPPTEDAVSAAPPARTTAPGEGWPPDDTLDEPTRPPKPRYGRDGLVIAAGFGAQICADEWCREVGFRVGAHGRFELGYRYRVVTALVTIAAGGGSGRWEDSELVREYGNAKSQLTFLDAGVGFMIHPNPRGRLDPWFGLRIGLAYAQSVSRSLDSNWTLDEKIRRGGVGINGGLLVHITDLISAGPRFDVTVPFSGNWCFELRQGGVRDRGCIDVRDFEEPEMLDSSELPLPATVTADVRVTIPLRDRN